MQKKKNNYKKILYPLACIGIVILTAILIKTFIKEKEFDTLDDELEFAEKYDLSGTKIKVLKRKMLHDMHNFKYHYEYIDTYIERGRKKNEEVPDEVKATLLDEYKNYESLSDTAMKDIANMGIGLIHQKTEWYHRAHEHFNKVKDTSISHYHFCQGISFYKRSNAKKAEEHFLKEIQRDGYKEGAYKYLAYLYYYTDQIEKLETLYFTETKNVENYVSFHIKSRIYLDSLMIWTYIKNAYGQSIFSTSFFGFIGALLIFICWLIYLRKIDIYEKERWVHILITFVLGVFFSDFVFIFSDVLNHYLKFSINGNGLNDFFYCVIGIGLIEEIVKIIPVLIILRFTKAINESVDYIIYGSVAALGFAFSENLIYFQIDSLYNIFGRSITAAVGHMFLTSFAAYGLMIGRYKHIKSKVGTFLLFLGVAAVFHGFYDFWLINIQVRELSFISPVFYIFLLAVFNTIIINALNHSVFYDPGIKISIQKLQTYLLFALTGIMVFQMLVLAISIGPDYSMSYLRHMTLRGGILVFFVTLNMGRIVVTKGFWKPLFFFNPFRMGFDFHFDYDKMVDTKVVLKRITRDRFFYTYFPTGGQILARRTYSGEPDWYFVKIASGLKRAGVADDFILIKSKNLGDPLKPGKKTIVGIFTIPEKVIYDGIPLERKYFHFRGWAIAKSMMDDK